jgi:hypothetical protein
MRVHLPGWVGEGPRDIETWMCQVQGVISARANPLTTNVLIHFDQAATYDRAILGAVGTIETDTLGAHEEEERRRRPRSASDGRVSDAHASRYGASTAIPSLPKGW